MRIVRCTRERRLSASPSAEVRSLPQVVSHRRSKTTPSLRCCPPRRDRRNTDSRVGPGISGAGALRGQGLQSVLGAGSTVVAAPGSGRNPNALLVAVERHTGDGRRLRRLQSQSNPIQVWGSPASGPNPSVKRSANGVAQGPRSALVYAAPRGPCATPSAPAYLER